MGRTNLRHGGINFEKESDNSREVCFIPLDLFLVFMSRLDPSFINKKQKKIIFFQLKNDKNALGGTLVCSPTIHTMNIYVKHSIWILNNPDGGIS